MRKYLFILLLWSFPALAQVSGGGIENWSAFNPIASTVLPVSLTSSNVELPPVNAPVAWVCNSGTAAAYLALGDVNVVADMSSFPIMSRSCGALAIGKGQTGKTITHVAGFGNEGPTTVTIVVGSGHP